MKIAPIDVAHKSFSRKMMGSDPDEVMDFLRVVADEMECLIRERNEMREALREKELAIIEFRERDDLLKSTITTATKMSDKIQKDAERESRLILSDANQQAEMIVRDARDSLRKIYGEVTELKNIRMQFENNLKAIVQSHLTMMEQSQQIMPSPQIEAPSVAAQVTSPSTDVNVDDADVAAIKANIAKAVAQQGMDI